MAELPKKKVFGALGLFVFKEFFADISPKSFI